MAKATAITQWLAVQFVVRVSESDINEADFTAVLSPLHFDLLDSHLLGWPVCLQNGERGWVEWGSWDRSWNKPSSLLASPTKAGPFIIHAPRLTKSKWWRPKKESLKLQCFSLEGKATLMLSYSGKTVGQAVWLLWATDRLGKREFSIIYLEEILHRVNLDLVEIYPRILI